MVVEIFQTCDSFGMTELVQFLPVGLCKAPYRENSGGAAFFLTQPHIIIYQVCLLAFKIAFSPFLLLKSEGICQAITALWSSVCSYLTEVMGFSALLLFCVSESMELRFIGDGQTGHKGPNNSLRAWAYLALLSPPQNLISPSKKPLAPPKILL